MARCAVEDDERFKNRYGTFGVSDLSGCLEGKMGGRGNKAIIYSVRK